MKPFLHIDDFGEDGFDQLTPLLVLSGRANIWAPSAHLLQQSKSNIGVKDLLWLIEKGYMSVTARRRWFFDKTFRENHNWAGARWNDSLDSPLQSMAKEDESRPRSERRVILAENETGYDKAISRVKLKDGKALEGRLRKLFNEQLLPVGIQEKAQTARYEKRSVPQQILRDYYNHIDAIKESSSDSLVSLDKQFLLISSVLNTKMKAFDPSESVSLTDFKHALNVITAISTIDSPKKLKKFLKSNHRNEISQVLFEYQNRALELPSELAKKISSSLNTDSSILKMTGFDQGFTHGSIILGGIFSGIIGAYADPQNPFSLVLTAISCSVPFLEASGLIRKNIKDPTIATLVYMAHQRHSATTKELKIISNKLSKL